MGEVKHFVHFPLLLEHTPAWGWSHPICIPISHHSQILLLVGHHLFSSLACFFLSPGADEESDSDSDLGADGFENKLFHYSQLHEHIPIFLTKLIFCYVSDQINILKSYNMLSGQGMTFVDMTCIEMIKSVNA